MCAASHPDDRHFDSWRCPLCQGELQVIHKDRDACADCDHLHASDQVACTRVACHFWQYGNTLSRLMNTRGVNICCRRCEGHGVTGGRSCSRCAGRGYHAPNKKAPELVAS